MEFPEEVACQAASLCSFYHVLKMHLSPLTVKICVVFVKRTLLFDVHPSICFELLDWVLMLYDDMSVVTHILK